MGGRGSGYLGGCRLRVVPGVDRAEMLAKCGHATGHFGKCSNQTENEVR